MPTLTVKSDIPNARPVTVTEASPERGKFPRADEATAAVAALSLEVNTLIAGLKAQLSTMYKIIIKLKNSIAAMK